MNLDDPTLLTAYLDGELDAPGRIRVESALESNPHLVERLQDLSSVRNLVGGMARPTVLFDVSTGVLEQIRPASPVPSPRVGRGPFTAGLVAVAAAATALAAVYVTSRGRAPERPDSHRVGVPADLVQTTSQASFPVATAPKSPDARLRPPDSVRTPKRAPIPYVSPLSPFELQAAAEHERLTQLLDRPAVRRMVVLLDSFGPDEISNVEAAIHRSGLTRPVQARLSVAQGLVIDPAHPDEAVVYTLVMNDAENRRFRKQLAGSLGRLTVLDDMPQADVVTQLADMATTTAERTPPGNENGQIPTPSPLPRSEAIVPSTAGAGPADLAGAPDSKSSSRPSGTRRQRARPDTKVAGADRRSRPPLHPSSSVGGEDTVYLVWLTTSPHPAEDRPVFH